MVERHSEHARDPYDWYVEPEWCDDDIFHRVQFEGTIFDPCVGMGTIVYAACRAGYDADGYDIVKRPGFVAHTQDFLQDKQEYENIVTNPPYRQAHQMALHALKNTKHNGRVAFLCQLKFLASQRRYKLWEQVERVIIYSKRPSMPPGLLLQDQGEACRGGGSIDFGWIVWRVGYQGPATIEWSLGPANESPSDVTLNLSLEDLDL